MDFACTIICRINFSKNQKICQWISFYDKLNNSRQICTLTNCFCKCIFPTSPLMTDGWLVGWYFCHNFLKGRLFTFPCSFSENLLVPWMNLFLLRLLLLWEAVDNARSRSLAWRGLWSGRQCTSAPWTVWLPTRTLSPSTCLVFQNSIPLENRSLVSAFKIYIDYSLSVFPFILLLMQS